MYLAGVWKQLRLGLGFEHSIAVFNQMSTQVYFVQ